MQDEKKEITLAYARYRAELKAKVSAGFASSTSLFLKILEALEQGNHADAHLIIEEHFPSEQENLIRLLKISSVSE